MDLFYSTHQHSIGKKSHSHIAFQTYLDVVFDTEITICHVLQDYRGPRGGWVTGSIEIE